DILVPATEAYVISGHFEVQALDLLQKIDMEKRAPLLPIGDAAQAGILLNFHYFANAEVLCLPQLLLAYLVQLELLASGLQSGCTQQATDMIGSKWGVNFH